MTNTPTINPDTTEWWAWLLSRPDPVFTLRGMISGAWNCNNVDAVRRYRGALFTVMDNERSA